MNNGTFFKVLIGVLVVGASYGGVFAGGVVYGKSAAPENATATAAAVSAPTATPAPASQLAPGGNLQGGPANLSPEQLAQLRQQFQSGTVDPSQFRNLQGTPVAGGPQGFFFGGPGGPGGQAGPGAGANFRIAGGATGSIKEISGDRLVLETAQGEVNVLLQPSVTVEKQAITALDRDSLKTGETVTVRGQRDAQGVIQAVQVILTEGEGAP